MNVAEAQEIVGGLSNPSKMPGRSISLPALECGVGSKLRMVENSVCSGCYALKGRYVFPATQQAQYRRLAALAHPKWIEAMAFLTNRIDWFRWHDSGDIQSMEHLKAIVEVARRTPATRHWLPTREYAIVSSYRRDFGDFPSNLVVRMSAPLRGARMPEKAGLNSMVIDGTENVPEGVYGCPSQSQGNFCGDCRACWNPLVQTVAYHAH